MPLPLCARRGISLLEVLISMFILLVGLLGVGALIPVGRLEVGKGDQYDRAATLGRAAIRELKVRGMLQPQQGWYASGNASPALLPISRWMTLNTGTTPYSISGFVQLDQTGNSDALPVTAAGTAPAAYCLDPWGMTYNVNANVQITNFAYYPAYAGSGTPPATIPLLTRISLAQPSTAASPPAMTFAQADRIFHIQDDLTYTVPTTGSGPATQQFYFNGANAQYRQSDGNYSWLVTIVPNSPTSPGVASNVPYNNQQYTVSVVVYYKRPVLLGTQVQGPTESATPVYPERFANVTFPGGGVSGGEVAITTGAVGGQAAISPLPGASCLNVKVGQWILLAGLTNTLVDPGSVAASMNVFRWYRVVAADDITDGSHNVVTPGGSNSASSSGPHTRNITLAGPDWNVAAMTANYAILCDGVVAVYEKTMPLERTSLWSTQ